MWGSSAAGAGNYLNPNLCRCFHQRKLPVREPVGKGGTQAAGQPEYGQKNQKGPTLFACFHRNPHSFYQIDSIVAYWFLGSLFAKFKIFLFLYGTGGENSPPVCVIHP